MANKRPNRVLREIRLAYRMTQRQLVTLLATELRRAGVNAAPDVRLVAAWEAGTIRWPGKDYRAALRRIFNVSTDAQLGFVPRENRQRQPARVLVSVLDSDPEDDMKRQTFLRGLAAVAFSSTLGEPLQPWLGIDPSQSIRESLIGLNDIAAIERTTGQFAQWENVQGGALSVDAVMGQLNWAATLLDQGRFATDRTRRRMCTAVANLAEVAGWSAYDAGLHDEARKAMALGVHAAAEGDDWPLRAALLADLARQAITLGHPREALDLLRLAHYGADGTATSTTVAMLHVTSARAYAINGQPQETRRAIGAAEDAYGNSEPANDPAWIRYYNDAQLAGDSGHALFDAARTDISLREESIRRLRSAVDRYGPAYPRSAALCHVRIAALRFDQSEPEAGAADGNTYLDVASGIVSARLASDSQMLLRRVEPYRDTDAVAELASRLSTSTEGGHRA